MITKEIKDTVKNAYANIARENENGGCCDNNGCCGDKGPSNLQVDYRRIEGHVPEADLALGCGFPTEIANIKAGDTVVDLGSGAGNDVFIARRIVGENGKVIGVDMTPEMVILALQNNQKLGYRNVEFQLGEIENMKGVADQTADVVISNCVLNLVPNKASAFSEIYRIMKWGGHMSISDIVYEGRLSEDLLASTDMYAGCVSGASEKSTYLGLVKTAGFKNIQVKMEEALNLPVEQFGDSAKLYSITVYAEKQEDGACCESNGSTCCTPA